ncbi:unnamed protein product [Peronospora farinosa]|uniref:Hook C-terminal domain-containing protein n=1 Tax=Peronospora farinosa TaxID=134698 RepID=A0AAV0TJ04_9STRA|nr:unnamed protein product [Peronospora farinosa]CAI5722359.1 unnamed protein product [Peronospora farinosa]
MATEAMSLMRWLGFYTTDRQEQCVSVVLRLLKLAFPAALSDRQGWEDVVMTLELFYETSLTFEIQKLDESSPETLRNVLELVLAAVVQCEAKETFVKDILSMDDAVQTGLMTIIERVMRQGARGEKDEEKKEEKEIHKALGRHSPLYLTSYAALEQQERKNKVLKEENIQLAEELTQTMKKYHEMKIEKEEMVINVQQWKEQMEADGLRRERSLHAEYEGRIQTLQLQLDAIKTELDDKTVLASKVPALRDEVDLLRPVASKLVKMEAAVVKYKAKIDELAGAKDNLRRLEGTNVDLIETNLALESQLAKAASWQRKLKEAKETNTIMEFRVSELKTQLVRERQELVLARADITSLQSTLQEAKALNAQLQQSADHLLSVDVTGNDNSSSAPTVASGISELNPELMQKLIRLEYENVALKNQVDSETGARIDGLLNEVDDMTRVKKYFEQKYFDSQYVLQSTTSEFKSTKAELDLTIARLQANAGQLREWHWCLQEDVAAQALAKQTAVAERDCLVYDGIERQHYLTRVLSSREHELSEIRNVNEALACQNERLIEQCERLSQRKEALEASLARQNECVAMQAEDAKAKELRLWQQNTRELTQICVQNKKQVADIISSMTLLVDAKSAEIVQLTSKLQKVKLEHDIDRQKLEAAHISTAKGLKLYQQQYSISNADWNTKEEKLKSRIEELERLCSQCTKQELALKSIIKSQLQSNGQLVAQNKVMKADAVKSRETIAIFENTTTRLESKVALLERQRSHFFAQEERKRDTVDRISSYSCQLSTQVTLVVAELEKVLEENKKLHTKQSRCHCCRESPRGTPDSDQKAKKNYRNRIQQMEHDQQQVEHKRRELLLVNAKLILEQKQLHVKNASLSNEIRELKESVNHWRLCDERRKKKEGHASLALENNVIKLPLPCTKRSTRGLPTDTAEQRAKPEHEQKTTELPRKSQNSSHDSSVAGLSSSLTNEGSVFPDHEKRIGKRKREQERDGTVGETTRIEAGSIANCNSTDAEAPTSGSTSTLRSHFIARSLAPDKLKQDTEKPSECNQQ